MASPIARVATTSARRVAVGTWARSLSAVPEPVSRFDPMDFQTKLYINGEFVDAKTGKTFPTVDPRDETVITEVQEAGAEDVDAAVAAAKAALPGWKRVDAAEKRDMLLKLADLLEEAAPELAKLESLDNGKPEHIARDVDIAQCVNNYRYFAGWADKITGKTIPTTQGTADTFAFTVREPVGVCGAVIPWNFPLLMQCWKLAPALASGCTIVMKLSEKTPLSGMKFMELVEEAGFPAGVVNMLNGPGATGELIARHPDIDKVAFTGSSTARRADRRRPTGPGATPLAQARRLEGPGKRGGNVARLVNNNIFCGKKISRFRRASVSPLRVRRVASRLSPMAAALKEGRDLYKAGQFKEAAAKFGVALEDESTETDQLHMIHSNRCACFMQLKDYGSAFDDAEACTSLKPGWAKGWARLGASLAALGKGAEAAAAYDKAGELDPANAAQYLNDGAKAKAKVAAATGNAEGGGGSYQRVPFPAATNYLPVGGRLENAHLLVRGMIVFSAAVYLASFTTDLGTLRARYRSTVKFLCLSLAMHWGRAHGRPKVDRSYAQRCMTDPGCQRLFGALILLLGQGSFIALLPILYYESAATAAAVVSKLKSVDMKKRALQVNSALEGVLLDGDGKLDAKLVTNCAYVEAGAGGLMVFELLTPRRNFILLVLYWQYMQMRVMLEGAASGGRGGPLNGAFAAFDARATRALGTPMCPALLRMAYGAVKKFAKSQVALPEPGKKPGLKCAIM